MAFSGAHEYIQMFRVLLILTSVYESFGSTTCPSIIRIEKGDDSLITCTSQTPFVDVYWYNGPTISTDPILLLQDGAKGGTEYGSAHYDITPLGEMVIKNANLDIEATYTFVAYFDDGRSEEANVTVIITSPPRPFCPTISSCRNCEGCSLNISEPGTLICNIYEARPKLHVIWEIDIREGIEFIQHQEIMGYNPKSDTWNSSATIAYEAKSCGGSAILRCLATNQEQSTTESENTVNIFTEPCSQDLQGSTVILIIVLAVIILATIIGSIAIFLYHKKNTGTSRKGGHEHTDEIKDTVVPLLPSNTKENLPQDDGDKATSRSSPSKKTRKKDPTEMERERGSFVRGLKRYYQQFCDEKALPGKCKITAANLYTHFQCLVTIDEETTEERSSDELLELDCIKSAKSIRFFGKPGYGKTTFAHHLLRQWVKEDANTTILIFLDMKSLKVEDDFFNCVTEVLSDDDLSRADVENVVNEYECLLLLDGCDEKTMVTINKTTEEIEHPRDPGEDPLSSLTTNNGKGDLKMKAFCDGSFNDKYPKLRVFMMTRDTISTKSTSPTPFLNVKLLGFSEIQIEGFIDNFCMQWEASQAKEGHTQKEKHDNNEIKFTEKFKLKINQILEEKGVLHETGKIPLLLTALAHVIADEVTNKNSTKMRSEDKIVNLTAGSGTIELQPQETKITELLRKIVKFLISQYSDEKGDREIQLGAIALHNKTQMYPYDTRDKWVSRLGVNDMEMGLSAGFLEEDYILKQNGDISVIKFSWHVFADYFAAVSLPSEEKGTENLHALIRDGKDDKENMVFQFICANNHPLIYKLVEFLVDYGMINNFIHCLFEVVNPDKIEVFHSGLQKWKEPKSFVIHQTSCYHQKALRNFCNLCVQWKIKLKTLTLKGFSISFLVSLSLPELRQLEVSETDLSKENDFGKITEWLTQQNISSLIKFVRFIDCSMPKMLSDKSLNHIKDLKEKNCHVERVNDEIVSKPSKKTKGWKGK